MTGISKAGKDHVLQLPRFVMATGLSILIVQMLHNHRRREKQRGLTAPCFKNKYDQMQFVWLPLPATHVPWQSSFSRTSSPVQPRPGAARSVPFQSPMQSHSQPGGPMSRHPPSPNTQDTGGTAQLPTLQLKQSSRTAGRSTFQVLHNPSATERGTAPQAPRHRLAG